MVNFSIFFLRENDETTTIPSGIVKISSGARFFLNLIKKAKWGRRGVSNYSFPVPAIARDIELDSLATPISANDFF